MWVDQGVFIWPQAFHIKESALTLRRCVMEFHSFEFSCEFIEPLRS